MVKQRFTALDVRASIEEMRSSLVGLRLLNLYDINSHMFIFKFGHGDQKKTVLLENGVRIHLSSLVREKPKIPSQFTLKVRKHIRSWRLDSITQLQHDRTIDMCFGVKQYNNEKKEEGAVVEGGKGEVGGGTCFHIIIELFSKGNVILTDHNYTIMMLLRAHKENGVPICVKATYPITAAFETAEGEEREKENQKGSTSLDRETELWEDFGITFQRNNENETMKATLSGVRHFGPALADHILEVCRQQLQKKENNKNKNNTKAVEVRGGKKKKEFIQEYCKRHAMEYSPETEKDETVLKRVAEEIFPLLLPGMLEAWDLTTVDLPPGGYLIRLKDNNNNNKEGKKSNTADASTPVEEGKEAAAAVTQEAPHHTEVPPSIRYEDFTPILFAQYLNESSAARLIIDYRDSFGQVCEEYFLYSETEKLVSRSDKKKNQAMSKREKFERDHQRRISALEAEQEKNKQIGELILLNADVIDEAMQLINGALAAGIQWESLKSLVKRRHQEGHPVAYMIHELLLEKNCISVLLEQPELYDDEDENEIPPMVVEVDLSKTAHANASDYFSRKKQQQVKLEKTLAATEKAAAGAARKAKQVEAKQPKEKKIKKERKRNWWEKFLFFRTSAGDLVLAGRDVSTTETLFRRIVCKGDLFLHSDIEGALPCLLRPLQHLYLPGEENEREKKDKDNREEKTYPVSKESLEEAGAWCISRCSSAWESKQTIGSWFIYTSQLTGGSASGVYLYSGEKTYIDPQPLSLGMGLLFFLEEDLAGSERVEEVLTVGTEYVVPADPCETFQSLPPLEAQRKPNSVAQRSPKDDHHAGGKKHRNARANNPQKQEEKESRRKGNRSDDDGNGNDNDEEGNDTSTTAAVSGRPLTKRDKRKLKKIKAKYGDQDEEDRLIAMRINGNKLSQVQLDWLAAEKERKRLEAQAQLEQEEQETEMEMQKKKEKKQLRKHQKGEEDEEEEEEEEIELVDDDDGEWDEVETTNETAEMEKTEPNAPSPPSAEEKEKEDKKSAAESRPAAQDAPKRNKPTSEVISRQHQEELLEGFTHYTKRPSPGQRVLHAVPVCCPFRTLLQDTNPPPPSNEQQQQEEKETIKKRNDYVCRVELVHGNMKKGQAAGSCITYFKEQLTLYCDEEKESEGSNNNNNNNNSNKEEEIDLFCQSLIKVVEDLPIEEVVEQIRQNVKVQPMRLKKSQKRK